MEERLNELYVKSVNEEIEFSDFYDKVIVLRGKNHSPNTVKHSISCEEKIIQRFKDFKEGKVLDPMKRPPSGDS